MAHYIKYLIAQGEHQQLDFKYELNDAKKIARTLSAFANTDGGKLLIGVKDNGVIKGIESDEEAYMVESAAELYSRPKIDYTIKTWNLEGKTVLEAIINESSAKPHLAPWKGNKWMAFVRVKDENILADPVQLEAWKRKKSLNGVIFTYNSSEKRVLECLKDNLAVNLETICVKSSIKKYFAKKILTKLVALDIVKIAHQDKETFFYYNKHI